jgi:putative sterol carrier protein
VLRIGDGRATAHPGEAEDPAVTLRTTVPVFARVAAQELHPAKAMLEGTLEIEGDFVVAGRIGEMFGQQSLL